MPQFDLGQLTEPERLALASLAQREIDGSRFRLAVRLEPLRIAVTALTTRRSQLTDAERDALGELARHEIETNRYPETMHLAPLHTAFAKLCPADPAPKPPASPKRKTGRRQIIGCRIEQWSRT